MEQQKKKCLIVYFSRNGDNYVNGQIVHLPFGNTEVAAMLVQKATGGELFQIKTVKSYAADYDACTKEAQEEGRTNARPELEAWPESIADYDAIFLGYPNWWGTMPMAVWTFLERYDFSGKVILPFCTHEGSGMGHSESDLKQLCPQATVLNGLAIHGSNVKQADRDIDKWVENCLK